MIKFNETEDLPDIKRKCLENRHAGNIEVHCYDMQAQVAVAGSDNSAKSYDSPSEDLIIESFSETISEEKMTVMRSSLLHTTWLHSMECLLPSSDTSSRNADSIILFTVISDGVPCIEESDPQPASKLKLSGVPNNHGKIEDTSLTLTLVPSTNTSVKKLDEMTGLSVALIRDAQVPLPTSKERAGNDHLLIPTGDIHGFVEILSACRAHRLQVLKAAAGKGILTPKAIQQLSQSASLLLIKIGNIECLPSISDAMTASEMPPSDQSSQSMLYSQSMNNTEESSSVNSLESYLMQSYALLSLNFYCAPDDLIAATTDYLLSKIDAQEKLNKWESKEQICPQTAVLYLIGVLLLRIRTLTVPASRLLFRALETAVKKTPNLAVSLLLPMIVKTVHKLPVNLVQESTQPQFEILTRVTRQSLSVEQCNELVRCLCSNAMPTNVSRRFDTASLTATVSAAANLVMLAMFSVHSNDHLLKSTSSSGGKGGQNNRKKTIGSVDHMPDLSTAEQNSHYQRWTASISTHLGLSLQHPPRDITHVWCESMGYPPEGRTLPDPELYRTIDTILKKVRLSPLFLFIVYFILSLEYNDYDVIVPFNSDLF